MTTRINIENFEWWLSLVDPSNLKDNEFELLLNMKYNKDKRIQTRWWITTFGNNLWSNPITSYFFFQNDTDGTRMALCTSWTSMYKYNEGNGDWDSIKTWLTQYESDGVTYTRWSYAVYLNKVYMCNGIDPYAEYDGTTYTEIGTSTVWTATFTNATNLVNLTSHGMSDGTLVKFTTTGTLPTELTEGKYYYVVNSNTNDFQLSLSPDGSVVTFSDDGTATTTATKQTQPSCRYLRYMADSIYGAGQDTNPSTIYATTAWAVNWRTLDANDIKVWGDELGRINGLLDLWDLLFVFKDKKIYSVAWDLASSTAIDSQDGWYCHRAIKNVENAIMYYSSAGVDRLKPREWLAWASSIVSKPLWDNLRKLFDMIHPTQRNISAGYYNNFLNNYYFSFDTGNDWVPNKTLVYSSLVGSWSEYNIPSVFDYGRYIDSSGNESIIAVSAVWWQAYELETWYQDFWLAIETELKTKRWDFDDIGRWKSFDSIDITGLKNEGSTLSAEIIVDGEVVSSGEIDDTYIDITSTAYPIGTTTIWSKMIWGWEENTDDWISLYKYLIRIPMYASWQTIQIRMYSSTNPNVWTLEWITINKNNNAIDLFPYTQIA